jgi:predicted negative regulator of RcsB-dependent stress response
MAAFDLEEQEQISQIKAWWEQNGKLVTLVTVLAAIASVGWQGWNWHVSKDSGEASVVYAAIQKAAAEHKPQQAREAAGILIDKYSGSSYADLGALLAARSQVDAGDLKNARAELAWLADHSGDAVMRDLARLRLASVMFDEKAYDEALARLQGTPSEGLAARFADLRGDILLAQGKHDEGHTAYKAAVEALTAAIKPESVAFRDLIQAKLDASGAAQ